MIHISWQTLTEKSTIIWGERVNCTYVQDRVIKKNPYELKIATVCSMLGWVKLPQDVPLFDLSSKNRISSALAPEEIFSRQGTTEKDKGKMAMFSEVWNLNIILRQIAMVTYF